MSRFHLVRAFASGTHKTGIPAHDVDRYDVKVHVMTRVSYAGYRIYVINDNPGQDPLRACVEARGGTVGGAGRRWRELPALLQSLRLLSEFR